MSNDVIARLRAAGYRVRTRRQWGSKCAGVYAERLRSKPVDLPVSYIFAHITVTSVNGDEGARLIEQIGMERFGSGVSYNWMVDHETHTIYEGQPLHAKGTHTVNDKNVAGYPYNLNYAGHAVAFMAMPGDKFCAKCEELFAAIQAAERLEDTLRETAAYLPHSKFAWKDCPTDAVRNALPRINKLADEMVNGKALTQFREDPQPEPAPKPELPKVSLSAVRRDARRDDWARSNKGAKDDVALIVAALEAEGCSNYRQWQVKLGYKGKDADGIPGKSSLAKLGRKHGFEVVE